MAAQRIQKIQSHGISVNGCFILGFDQDDEGVFERTLEFVEESGLAEVQITILTPFPGTALHRQLEREGRLLRPVYWDQCTLFDVTYEPKQMTPDALERGFTELMKGLYSESATSRRKQIMKQNLRESRRRSQLPATSS